MACNCNDLSASLTAINNKVDALMKENATLKAQVSNKADVAQVNGLKEEAFNLTKGWILGKGMDSISKNMLATPVFKQAISSIATGVVSAVAPSFIATGIENALKPTGGFFARLKNTFSTKADVVSIFDKGMAEVDTQRIRSLNKTLAEFQAKLEKTTNLTQRDLLRKQMNEYQKQIDGIKQNFGRYQQEISGKVNRFSGTIESIKNTINNLSNKVSSFASSFNAQLNKFAGALAAINLILTAINIAISIGTLKVLGRRIDILEGGLAQQGNTLSFILGRFLGIQNKLSRLESLGLRIPELSTELASLRNTFSNFNKEISSQISSLKLADKAFATRQYVDSAIQGLIGGAIATVGGIAASALATAAIAKLTAGAASVTANSALRLAQQRPAPVNQTIYIDRTRTINQTQIIRQQTTIDRTRTINQTQVIDRTRTINQTDPRLNGRVSALERSQSALATAQAALSARVSSLQNFFSRQVTNIRNTTNNITNNVMDSALLQQIFNQTKQNNLAIAATRSNVLNNGVVLNNTAQKVNIVDQKIGVFPAKSTIRIAGSETGETQEVEFQNLTQATQQAITSANNAEVNLGIPFRTPKTLIKETVNPTITHLDFASIISWIIYQMDALIGEFPIKLEIEDSDLMKTGDQTLKLEFPNIAETLAEMAGLAINSKAVTEANLDASMRTLMESGSGRKQAIVNHALLEAIQDYLGFSSRQKIIEVPFTYNPIDAVKNDKIGDALKESTQKVKVEENTDPDTLEKQLKILREAAAITKTVHFKKLSPNSVDQWTAEMKASRDQTAKKDPDQEKDDFDQFLDNVEQGWATQTGDDPTAPYDRNFEERPRVRRLSQGGEGNG